MKTNMPQGLSAPRSGKHGLIIFDGSCGACSAFVGHNKSFFEKYGFAVAAFQEPWVPKLLDLDESILSQAIHLRTSEGEILRGVDFFRYVAGKIWWLVPINLLLRIKVLRPGFERLYDLIAKRRRTISAVCGLQSKAFYKTDV